jgi:hypothetical protein
MSARAGDPFAAAIAGAAPRSRDPALQSAIDLPCTKTCGVYTNVARLARIAVYWRSV